jgi:eukaryotic-like serine/threonine-protein kinase
MVSAARACLSDEVVLRFCDGGACAEELSAIERHLAECEDCAALVAETALALEEGDPERLHTNSVLETVIDHRLASQHTGLLVPGTAVGRYEVLDLLGRGGVGVVYVAHDPGLRRQVALKLLRNDPGGGASTSAALLREARAMAQLSHPNVVTVYDVGTWRDRVFIAMELVRGRTLRAWLRDESRSVERTLELFCAAAEGLSAAHASGVIHRDFKPDNVLVTREERVKVTDFGLARPMLLPTTEAQSATTTLEMTANWLTTASEWSDGERLAGTPAYMAPEQFAGEPSDTRTDQFSFCVALYEALCGERPFAGDSLEELSRQVLAGRVRPPPARTRLPLDLRSVILRGLERDPGARFPSVDALVEALHGCAWNVAPASVSKSGGTPGKPWRAVGGLAIAAAIVGGIAMNHRSPRPASAAAAGTSAPAATPTIAREIESTSPAAIETESASASASAAPAPARTAPPDATSRSTAHTKVPTRRRWRRRTDTRASAQPPKAARPLGNGLPNLFPSQ